MRIHQNEYYDSQNTIKFTQQVFSCNCQYEYIILTYLATGSLVYDSGFFHVYRIRDALSIVYEDIPNDEMFNISLWILDGLQEAGWVENDPEKPTYYRISEQGWGIWKRIRIAEQEDSMIFPFRT